jgi:long-chain acyl-CoA synthetase
MNFAQALRRSRRLQPSGTVLLHGERRVDYLGLDMAAQRIATILARRHGIAPGDRVAVLLPDTPEFAFAAYGILWAGAVLCALDPDTDPHALGDALQTVGAKLLIGWHARAETVEQVSDALGIDWLLVEPREFSRLLAAAPPRAPLADVAGDAPAILLGPAPPLALGHADLATRANAAADEMGLEPGAVVAVPQSLSDPVIQIRTLHAAVAAGAALSLPATAAVVAEESSWR